MAGSYIVDDSVMVVETHHPWCVQYAPEFSVNKLIVMVRNPLDLIMNWLNEICLQDPEDDAAFDYDKEYPKWWNTWSRQTAFKIADWYGAVMADAKLRKVPLLWVRWEDLE
jgi:hypothetical protein